MRARSRSVVLATVAGSVLALSPAVGLAAAPTPLPPATYVFGPGTVCSFAISFQETTQGETVRELPRSTHVTGAYKGTVTNLDNGKTLSFNVPGPTIGAASPGPWLFLLFPSDATGPGIFLLRGRTVATRDSSGNIDSLTTTGNRSPDLCGSLL